MNAHLVIDPMFGDGGKGITTDRLASKLSKPIVIRSNGGQNAGHTVITIKGVRHVFSMFGSGSFRGVPTYWSKYCTVHIIGFVEEWNVLKRKGVTPTLYMDNMTMVTTPYDALYNQALEKSRHAHGSMGVGFGVTIERHTTTPHKFHVQDLFTPNVLEQKLKAVFNYYQRKVEASGSADLLEYWNRWDFDSAKSKFLEAVEFIKKQMPTVHFVSEAEFWGKGGAIRKFHNLIFEGSQGIMLDMDFGFFPNVTRSNCTSKNALELFRRYFPDTQTSDHNISVYYVTRAYQTRHGNGYMTNEGKPLNVRENRIETNTYGEWQGSFRRTILDFDLLNFAIQADCNFSGDSRIQKNMVVICLDQVDGYIHATGKGREFEINPEKMEQFLNHIDIKITNLFLSRSDVSDNMEGYDVWRTGKEVFGLSKHQEEMCQESLELMEESGRA